MVVFEDARPKPADYRIFSIRTVQGPNDFASMEEVLSRRLAHLDREEERDQSLGIRPDLIIVDGGVGQLASADRALTSLGLSDLPHFGLAKRFEELYVPGLTEPIHLPQGGSALFLVQRIRDEAHRFAITRHRAKRAKAGVRSRLDEIGGLGRNESERCCVDLGRSRAFGAPLGRSSARFPGSPGGSRRPLRRSCER